MKTLIELFEKSVEKYPENPLLWEKSDRLIHILHLIGKFTGR